MEAAFAKLETVEHTAKIVTLARQLGPVTALDAAEVARLRGIVGATTTAEPDIAALVARATAAVLQRLAQEGRS